MESVNPAAVLNSDTPSLVEASKHTDALFATERLSFNLAPSYPLRVFANRYTPPNPCEEGYTLVLVHAIGMHKETWEPMLGSLFSSAQAAGHRIREAYSFDIPNHGESAVHNAEDIKKLYGEEWSMKDSASAFNLVLTAPPSAKFPVDFSKRKLVGVGHSIGAAVLFLMHAVPTPPPTFQSLIIIEPGVVSPVLSDTHAALQSLSAWNWIRKDTWSSLKSARAALSHDASYAGTWDERVLNLYVKHALTPHAATKYEGAFKFTGVTTAISRVQEAACYRTDDLLIESIKAYTATFARPGPPRVHIIWGAERSVITPRMQRALCDVSQGHRPASVRYVTGAGHLAVQRRPDDIAHALGCVLYEEVRWVQQCANEAQLMRARL